MRKRTTGMLVILAVLLGSFTAQSANVIVQGQILSDVTWTSNNTYFLRGGVFVGNDATKTILTIQPGTVIKGEHESAGFLCIRRHSKIIADGTLANPITFTSDKPIGQQARGDWGGLIINGLSHVNLPGGVGQGEGATGTYGGGLTPDEHDNSGILRYVRIAYSGFPITPEDELNGIAFQGVGDGTIVDYVQVLEGGDDCMEFFGGSVNVKHIYLVGALDDHFDWTFSYNGKAQFVICQEFGDIGDKGFECDNNEFNYSAEPYSNPTLYNVTFIGQQNAVNQTQGCLWRRGTKGKMYNAIFENFRWGFDIDDAITFNNAWDSTTQSLNGNLILDNSIFYGNQSLYQTGETGSQLETAFPFTSGQFLQTLNPNNRFTDPLLIAPLDTINPNFAPAPGSIALSGYAQPPVTDPFFNQVSYVGACNVNDDWTAGWRLTPSGGGQVSSPVSLAAGWNLISLQIIPANNSLSALFPTATVAYKYVPGSGYINSTTIENGKAYWVNVPAAVTTTLTGIPYSSYNVPVTPPWEMLGSVYEPDQTPIAHNGTVNVVYSYTPGTGYVASPNNYMQPGKGYWVNMTTGTDSIQLGGTVVSSTPQQKATEPGATDDVWSMTLTATGQAGSAPNVFTNVIGGANSQTFIPAPPPPPSYMTYTNLYTDVWAGPYIEMAYQWPPAGSILWKLEVDPNGNVAPPVSRTTVISWNHTLVPAGGTFLVINAVYGDTVVHDMAAQDTFSVTGTQLKYYNIVYLPNAPPVLDVTLTPINPPIVVPANGGAFSFNIGVIRNVGPAAPYWVWVRIKNPNGTYTAPTVGPVQINTPVGLNVSRVRNQNVPSSWAPGVYTQLAYANSTNSYPAIDSSSFTWVKSTAVDGGPFVENANCFGDPFPYEVTTVQSPIAYLMAAISPNPFNPTTTINFSLPEAMKVSLNVYDVQGRLVASLVNGFRAAGNHRVTFDGSALASGVYLYRLSAGQQTVNGKLLLMK